MLCQKCKKNNAGVFYKEIKNGETKSFAYCSACAEEAQKSGEISFGVDIVPSGLMKDIDSLITGIFSTQSKGEPTSPSKAREKSCDLCKITIAEIASSGKVGCPKCYDTFADELAGSIKRIHGNVSHTGRTPKLLKDKFDKKKRLRTLKSELQSAIESQEFEKAASLRDEIRALES
jgi:Uncharacterized protein with conserved CXXC pairs